MANDAATITMNMREVNRLKTAQAVVDRLTRVGQAAQRLGLSRRQLERLIQRYKDEGAAGLVSRKRGRPGNRQLAPGVALRAIGLIRERYADFGPTLACEKLAGRHGLTLGVETVRTLVTAAGLWTPRKQRVAKIHQPRNMRSLRPSNSAWATKSMLQISFMAWANCFGCGHRHDLLRHGASEEHLYSALDQRMDLIR
ncbi:Transposase [Variovorax sp. YR752]|nr:Transposase [Variovorax sp. YR752]